MSRVILHLDMDAFYASVEQRDRPELRGRPVIVGSPPDQRGVVCAASYEARKFGVRSAMPSRTAGRLCPNGIFVRPRMDQYREESHAIFRLVRDAGVVVEQVSVDEAYLEASHLIQPEIGSDPDARIEAAVPLARQLKASIREARQLTASIGVASNKLLAKLASDFKKPDGLTLIRDRERVAFLRPLPCRALHGVGAVTAQALAQAGLHTIGDLQDYPGDLRSLAGSFGPVLKRFALGDDDRPLELGDLVKSISSENTFLHDTADRPTLRQCLREQAEEIATKLQRRRLAAKTVQIKVRYGDFKTLTRQLSVEEPVTEARDLYRLGCWLLARERLVHRPLRLLGLGASGLMEVEAIQLALPYTSGPVSSHPKGVTQKIQAQPCPTQNRGL
ncbi:MAG TPA: DNA polymerase IV [Verrucomicrobiota bacterium]|nr:DNA polymerase IV [Verrucomicrobiota bacterium]